jgi:L-fuculose-phosphate aldolase
MVSVSAGQTADPRAALLETVKLGVAAGLFIGMTGNLSVRASVADEAGFYVTPSACPYEGLTPDDIPWVSLAGAVRGRYPPSSEWRLHRDIYQRFSGVGAVLHAHSPYAVALACLRREIPSFHYMIARFGGATLPCAPYAPFGSQVLSDAVSSALTAHCACLMANHGMVTRGRTLAEALDLGRELEMLCQQYALACQMGRPVCLSPAEMADALARFHAYAAGESG